MAHKNVKKAGMFHAVRDLCIFGFLNVTAISLSDTKLRPFVQGIHSIIYSDLLYKTRTHNWNGIMPRFQTPAYDEIRNYQHPTPLVCNHQRDVSSTRHGVQLAVRFIKRCRSLYGRYPGVLPARDVRSAEMSATLYQGSSQIPRMGTGHSQPEQCTRAISHPPSQC